MAGGEVEVQDQLGPREVDPQDVVQPGAAVAQADPDPGGVHAHLAVLAAELGAQRVEVVEPGQVAGLSDRPGGGGGLGVESARL